MAIKTLLTVSSSSTLTIEEMRPFEQKIQAALANSIGQNAKGDIYCNINFDASISREMEKRFQKVGKNIFIGFSEGASIDGSLRRAFIFECLAIKDEKANCAKKIFLIISTIGFVRTLDDSSVNSESYKSEDNESEISFDAVMPKYSLDKVILGEATRKQIARALALIRNQKLIFDIWGFRNVDPNTKTILCFFGAPGTGKTMCAHAIAKELGKKIMIASYASIESKWVGEGPKNMRKIFKDAVEQDALLFFDEADSFLSKRVNNAETSSDKHYNRMSNEMFQLLEEYDGVVIFATNLVSNFDKAFKSRILSFIEFTLPDSDTRAKLIETMIPSQLPLKEHLSANAIQQLVKCSDGFSGREIRKSILTSLSEGALNDVKAFSLDDLLVGFESVRQERSAIIETASKERNIIADYLETNEQNRSIIEVCQWALSQQDHYTDSAKETLYKICKVLNLEMPDLSVSYKNKNLDSAYSVIINANRIRETMLFVLQLLSESDMEHDVEENVIHVLSSNLGFEESLLLFEYLNSLKHIMSV